MWPVSARVTPLKGLQRGPIFPARPGLTHGCSLQHDQQWLGPAARDAGPCRRPQPGQGSRLVPGECGAGNGAWDLLLVTVVLSYSDWMGGADAGFGLPPFSQFAADFAKLGPDVSILSFGLWYVRNQAALNAQGNKLTNLFPFPANIPVPHSSNGQNTTRLMCVDLISHPSALQQMALAPPVSVEQPYLQCQPTMQSALITAAGLAAANECGAGLVHLPGPGRGAGRAVLQPAYSTRT